MNALTRFVRYAARRRRLLLFPSVALVLVAAVVLSFSVKAPSSAQAETTQGPTTAEGMAKTTTANPPSTSTAPTAARSVPTPTAPRGEPTTLDYRKLALAAAPAIYTWDTRTATYSDVYANIRSWWEVLPDGSNPLTVFAQELEATGINAAAFASLAGSQAYRTAAVVSSACDSELTEVHQHPAPWVGLHVCTVTVQVAEHQTGGGNSYTVPLSVMVNCPPAASAPAKRCAMVAFYSTPSRIVY